jgi:hypothetical protein
MMETSMLPPDYQQAIGWLQAPPEGRMIYERHLVTCPPGITNWIFEDGRYQDWLQSTGRSTLWIFGPREIPQILTSWV